MFCLWFRCTSALKVQFSFVQFLCTFFHKCRSWYFSWIHCLLLAIAGYFDHTHNIIQREHWAVAVVISSLISLTLSEESAWATAHKDDKNVVLLIVHKCNSLIHLYLFMDYELAVFANCYLCNYTVTVVQKWFFFRHFWQYPSGLEYTLICNISINITIFTLSVWVEYKWYYMYINIKMFCVFVCTSAHL